MPAGWTLLSAANSGAAHRASLFWRRAAAGDIAPLVTHTGGGSIIARIIGFSGTDRFTASPFDVANSFTVSPADLTTEAGAITTVTANTMLVFTAHMADNHTSLGVPAGSAPWALAFFNATALGTDSSIGAYFGLRAAAGVQAAVTATRTGAAAAISHGAQLALRPALTIAKPAGTVQDDVMIASIAARPNTVTITPPAGWTLVLRIDNAAASASSLAVYRKTAGASEPAQYTWAISASTGAAGGIQSFANVDTVNPIDVGANPLDGQNTPSSTMHATPNRTTSVPDTMLVASHAYASSGTWTPPGGMTEGFDTASLAPNNGAGISIEGNNVIQAAAGATGAKTATATAAADVGNAHILALRPRAHHFAIAVAGGASADTCTAKNITITAQDVFNGTVANYTGTINITTSSAHGDWAVVTANGVLANGTADDGAATYSFVAADAGVVTLALTDTHADDLTVTVQDSTRPSTASTSITINFRGNDFVIANDPIQVAGRNQAMSATMRVGSTCGTTNTAYTGVKSLKAWITRDGADPAGAAPTIGAVSLPNAAPGANNVTLTFASGVVSFNLGTTDVGKYVLNLRDDSLTFATGAVINGSSSTITTRPFTLAISGIKQGLTNNPGTTSAAGTVFARAGSSFEATLGAYRWSATADGNNDGVPDAAATFAQTSAAGLAPSFAATVNLSAVAPFTPAAGGVLNNGSFAMAAGSANPTNLNFTEVGSFSLSTGGIVTNYLGTIGVNLNATVFDSGGAQVSATPVVGRFIPNHFVLSGGVLTNRQAAACAPASSFSYLGEGMRAQFTLTATNFLGATTVNYAAAFARLDLTTAAQLNFGAMGTPPVGPAANLTARTAALSPVGSFTAGAASLDVAVAVNRATPDNPDGPFTSARLGVAPSDPDGVALLTAALNMDVDGAGGNDHQQVGANSEVRFGRLRLQNAVGSEKLDLAVPIQTQYWNGSAFVTNSLDSCTALPQASVALSGETGALVPAPNCRTFVQQTPNVTFGSAPNPPGVGKLTLSKTAAGATGSLLLTARLGAAGAPPNYCTGAASPPVAASDATLGYLLGRWNDNLNPDGDANTNYDDNPSARISFGVYGAQPRQFIFYRENH